MGAMVADSESAVKKLKPHGHRPPTVDPTPEEMDAMRLEIQSEWSEYTRQTRAGIRLKDMQPYTISECRHPQPD
jgi:hypothetical protein